MSGHLGRAMGWLFSPWLEQECAGCRRAGESPCDQCLLALHAAPSEEVPTGLSGLRSLVAYDDASRPFITAFKRSGDPRVLGLLIDGLVDLVPSDAGALTWAPTTPRRRRERGHDQAQVLTAIVGRRTGLPVIATLVRSDGPSQEGRTAPERRRGIEFDLRSVGAGHRAPLGGPLVIIDDVVTTGSTMEAAARALTTSDLGPVSGLSLARTPPHGRSGA